MVQFAKGEEDVIDPAVLKTSESLGTREAGMHLRNVMPRFGLSSSLSTVGGGPRCAQFWLSWEEVELHRRGFAAIRKAFKFVGAATWQHHVGACAPHS
jgi:hypothetical protein